MLDEQKANFNFGISFSSRACSRAVGANQTSHSAGLVDGRDEKKTDSSDELATGEKMVGWYLSLGNALGIVVAVRVENFQMYGVP